MTTITRERVAEIIHAAGLEPCDYEEVFGSIKTGEIVAMARIALASLTAEPVFFITVEGDDWIQAGRVEGKKRFDLGLLPDGINFLYANPPVVNCEPIYQVQYDNDWRDVERSQYDDHAAHGSPVRIVYAAQPAPVVPPEQHWEELCRQHPDMSIGDAIIRAAWWNSCRAAMLQGSQPVSDPNKLPFVTDDHKRVIEMLLNVCKAAFELADDSCQQEVDGESCHVVPDDSFKKLSDALDEIENTLPTEDVDRPDVFLAWSAMPRAALKSILQAGNSPVIPDGYADMLQRWLAFGRGMQKAGSELPRNLITETEIMLAAAPQQEVKGEQAER